ncbi:Isochorismatase-like protein [Mycena amicta]|nr:Isochorismatase-like protein [Mycena amicta]
MSQPSPDSEARIVLLLLNVQRGLLSDPATRIPNAPSVLENIRRVLDAARGAEPGFKPRIIHVRNTGEPGEPDEEGKPSWALVLHAADDDEQVDEVVVDKKKSNAFSVAGLEQMISPEAEIVVVGVMSEYSVKSTIKAALGRGNTVILMRGAHGTYDHVELANHGNAGAMILDMELLPNLFDGR